VVGCSDGTIRIFNVLTGKQSFILNSGMEETMPTTMVKWRPTNGPGITKNVLISVNASGKL
jgi:WD40 repeat protein